MGSPASCGVVSLGGGGARDDESVDVIDEWFLTLHQIAWPRQPVIHLQIDIQMIIRVPRRHDFIAPQTLKICRQTAGPATAHQQITSVLEVEFF